MTLHSNLIAIDKATPETRAYSTALHGSVLWRLVLVCATTTGAAQAGAQELESRPQPPAGLTTEAATTSVRADQSTLIERNLVANDLPFIEAPAPDTLRPLSDGQTQEQSEGAEAAPTPNDAFVGVTSASVTETSPPLTSASSSIRNVRAAQVALERGRELAKLGLLQLAERQWREAVRLAPDWVEARRALGYFLSGHEQWLEASTQWREVLRLTHLRLMHQNDRDATAEVVTESKRRLWESEAQREFDFARSHLLSQWQAPDVVSLSADSRNVAPSGSGLVTITAHATLHPARVLLESKRVQQDERDAARKQDVLRAAQLVRKQWRQVGRKQPTQASSRASIASRVRPHDLTSATLWPRDENSRLGSRLIAHRVSPARPSIDGAAKRAMMLEGSVARRRVAYQIRKAAVFSQSLQSRWLARIALERAEQLATSGVPALAEAQLQQAIHYAPSWSETHRALARWHTKQEHWAEAALAWSRVLSLPGKTSGHEALRELRRLRQMSASLNLTSSGKILVLASTSIVMLGADSANASTAASGVARDRAFVVDKEFLPRTVAVASMAPRVTAEEGRLATGNEMDKSTQSTLALPGAARLVTATARNQVAAPPLKEEAIERMPVAKRLEAAQESGARLPFRGGRWVLSLRVPAAAEAAHAASVPIAGGAAFDGLQPPTSER